MIPNHYKSYHLSFSLPPFFLSLSLVLHSLPSFFYPFTFLSPLPLFSSYLFSLSLSTYFPFSLSLTLYTFPFPSLLSLIFSSFIYRPSLSLSLSFSNSFSSVLSPSTLLSLLSFTNSFFSLLYLSPILSLLPLFSYLSFLPLPLLCFPFIFLVPTRM